MRSYVGRAIAVPVQRMQMREKAAILFAQRLRSAAHGSMVAALPSRGFAALWYLHFIIWKNDTTSLNQISCFTKFDFLIRNSFRKMLFLKWKIYVLYKT